MAAFDPAKVKCYEGPNVGDREDLDTVAGFDRFNAKIDKSYLLYKSAE